MIENVAVRRKKRINAPERAGKLAAIELMMIRRDVTRLIRRSTRNARMSLNAKELIEESGDRGGKL